MQKVTELGTHCYCGSGEFTTTQVQEQMLGFKDSFTYAVCKNCGHAWLLTPPADLAKYYPQGIYYSFQTKKSRGLRSFFPSAAMKVLKKIPLGENPKILDYGCGSGQFVQELKTSGITGATGYDPFLPNDGYDKGVPVLRQHLNAESYQQYYDVITMNHVLEHLANPLTELETAVGMLKRGGYLIIRVPVKDSYAAKRYGANWAQWDAPRHFHLFTRMSLRAILSKLAELKEIKVYDDSNHFQFTASEIYEKGGSLKNDNRFLMRALSLKTYIYFFKAKQLNKQNMGDQLTMIARKSQ